MLLQYVFAILAVITTVLIILSQTALWQRKEYRIDRMRAYLTSPEGNILLHVWWIAGLAIVGLAYVHQLLGRTVFADYLAMAAVVSIFIGYAMRAVRRGISRPKPTGRSVAVLALAVVAAGIKILAVYPSASMLAYVVCSMPIIVMVSVGVVAVPSILKKRSVIARAAAYRKSLTHLAVIGITGSVGKTSTKTYISHILQQYKGEVVATKEHRNAPFTVAQDMLTRLHNTTSLYIAEMAAYRKGEIKELSQLVQPSVGVITAITNQHVALFGSPEKLAQAKWELAEGVSETGTLVLNKDDAQSIRLAKTTEKHIVWFSMKGDADVMFQGCEYQEDATVCMLAIGAMRHSVTLPVISQGQVASALAAAATAHAVGLPYGDIVQQLFSLPVLERTMERRQTSAGATVIDDSYSASEASVCNALEYMQKFGGKDARIILVPIIELGDEGARVHEHVGKMLAGVKAHVYIYGFAYREDIARGLGSTPQAHVVWYDTPEALMHDAVKNITQESTILFEGRVPQIVRKALV